MSLAIESQVLLKDYTTMAVGGPADFFCRIATLAQLDEAFAYAKKHRLQIFILGGGSNVIVSDTGFRGLVLKLENRGLTFELKNDVVHVHTQAGESWDALVKTCVAKNFWGIENLSHIPGSVGAVAVQNVGAYGQEVSHVIEKVLAIDSQTAEHKTFAAEDCNFGYRSSIFNTTKRGRYVIWEITFTLSLGPKPVLGYRDVANYFQNRSETLVGIEEIRNAIIDIRDRKFTLPSITPNAGSCFKNVYLSEYEFRKVKHRVVANFGDSIGQRLETIVWKEPDGKQKVPAAFLLDICGLKGQRVGGASINSSQPLVILNSQRTATAKDIVDLIKLVRKTVYTKTGVGLTLEPELIGFTESELDDYVSLD